MPQYNSALGLFHFASKHMTTKAQLEAQVTDLQDQLAAAQTASQPAELTEIEKRKQRAKSAQVSGSHQPHYMFPQYFLHGKWQGWRAVVVASGYF